MEEESKNDKNLRITVGRYELMYEISSGGMGTVYRGRDMDLDRAVAVKMLSKDVFTSIDHQLRFIQEAKIIAKLDHPNIMKIYGIEYSDENAYLVMEYLKGEALDEIIFKQGAIPYKKAEKILIQLAAALSHAHSRGVVHLDVKPSNVHVCKEWAVKLMDFGISKDKNEDFNLALSENTSSGSPKYMSPEQFSGSAVNLKSDIYSFGVLAYELLTGYAPYNAESIDEYRELHMNSIPPSLSKRTKNVPKKLLSFISACMEKDPAMRPDSLAGFADAIKPSEKKATPLKKNQYIVIASVVILAILAIFFIFKNDDSEKNIVSKKKKPNINLTPYIKSLDKKEKTVKPSEEVSKKSKQGSAVNNAQSNLLKELKTINKKETEKKEEPEIVEKNTGKSKEHTQVVPIITYLTNEQTAKIINESEFKKQLMDLTFKGKRSGSAEESFNECVWEMSQEDLKNILPLLQSEDAVLVKNIAEIFSARQFDMAIQAIQARLQSENNINLSVFLIQSLEKFFAWEALDILNSLFLQNDSPEIMIELMRAIEGRATQKSFEKAETLKIVAEDEHLKICIDALIASMGGKVDIGNAFDLIIDKKLKSIPAALRVIRYVGGMRELQELNKYRRLMYKKLKVMREYLKTNAILSTQTVRDTAGRYEQMVAYANKDASIISWIIYKALRSLSLPAVEWAKNALTEYNCSTEIFYQVSYHSLDKVDELLGEIARKKKELLLKSAKEKQELTGKIRFLLPEENITVKINGRVYAVPYGKEVSFPVGTYKLELSSGSAISSKREVEVEDNVIVEVAAKRPDLTIKNSLGMSLCYIPQGDLITKDLEGAEVTAHITSPFYAASFEVRNIEYEQYDPFHAAARDEQSKGDHHPVVMVSWEDAVKFCNWLSKREKLDLCYDENFVFYPDKGGYRLLTEAEWEYIASGGIRRNKYPWGNNQESGKANLRIAENDSFEFSSPAGSFAPNIFGIYDLGGNVSEWCTDWYSYNYPVFNGNNSDDPVNLKESDFKVFRGASWYSDTFVPVGERNYTESYEKSNTLGFRIARTSEPFSINVKTIRKPD